MWRPSLFAYVLLANTTFWVVALWLAVGALHGLHGAKHF
jgi:hypothetical protein